MGRKYIIPNTSAIRSQVVHKAENKTTNTKDDDKYIHSLRYTQVRLPIQQAWMKIERRQLLIDNR